MNSYRTLFCGALFASWLLFSPALAQAVAASPDGTSVPPASRIVDGRGNVWTLTANGQIARNGRVDRITNSVLLLVYSDGAVYQKTSWTGNDGQNLWWRWSRRRGWMLSLADFHGPAPERSQFVRLCYKNWPFVSSGPVAYSAGGRYNWPHVALGSITIEMARAGTMFRNDAPPH